MMCFRLEPVLSDRSQKSIFSGDQVDDYARRAYLFLGLV